MKKRTDIAVLYRMLKELDTLSPVILLTILFGVGGYIAAAAIATMSTAAAVSLLHQSIAVPIGIAIIVILLSAVFRGVLRYAEQLSGHYIAFKILAILRDKVFSKLRELAPAKLDTKEKGNLVSVITSDIEMMEVFYAHTIAPVMIAILTSAIYTIVLAHIHIAFGLFAAAFYILIGFALPLQFKQSADETASEYRQQLGRNSSLTLDSMRGLREILMFGAGDVYRHAIDQSSDAMGQSASKMKHHTGIGFAVTDAMVIVALLGCLIMGYRFQTDGSIDTAQAVVALVLLVSSFGPVIALSSLSTTLAGTLASARRVFAILDEEPAAKDVHGKPAVFNNDVQFKDVFFSYPSRDALVLNKVSTKIGANQHVAIIGSSGSGKSTMLKLLMRFYDVDAGTVRMGNHGIHKIPTQSLRKSQAIVSQETFLFNDTIENNIRMENDDMTMQDVINAAKKAAIHDTINKLPQSYQTNAGELGERFSSGEKQRIALARVFLTNSRMLLLDEPTSNLDVLSEAEILKSIQKHCADQTVILVSHRTTTVGICNRTMKIQDGRLIQPEEMNDKE